MKSSKAPKGFYTHVSIRLTLSTYGTRTYEWATPMALQQARSRCLSWAKEEMTRERVPGRSKIIRAVTDVEYKRSTRD